MVGYLLLVLFVILTAVLIRLAFNKYYVGKGFEHLTSVPSVVIYSNISFIVFHNKDFLINLLKGNDYIISHNLIIAVTGQLYVMVIQTGLTLEIRSLFKKALSIAITQLLFCFYLFWIADDIGIIKPVWFFLLIMATMGYIFISWVFFQIEDLFKVREELNDRKDKVDLVEKIQAESNRVFKTILQAILALGASLGLAMSILYKNGSVDWQNGNNSNSAFGMLLSFGLVVLGCSLFLGKPYLSIILRSKEFYKRVLAE